MPLKECTVTEGGKTKHGWKYGDNGHCFVGNGAKKKAIKQGLAIQYNGGEKFKGSQASDDEEIPLTPEQQAEIDAVADRMVPRSAELADDLARHVRNELDNFEVSPPS